MHDYVYSLKEIENTATEIEYEKVNGLGTFYSMVDSDEMAATTELTLMPTLAYNVTVVCTNILSRSKYNYEF